jgi:hypothetical protein
MAISHVSITAPLETEASLAHMCKSAPLPCHRFVRMVTRVTQREYEEKDVVGENVNCLIPINHIDNEMLNKCTDESGVTRDELRLRGDLPFLEFHHRYLIIESTIKSTHKLHWDVRSAHPWAASESESDMYRNEEFLIT